MHNLPVEDRFGIKLARELKGFSSLVGRVFARFGKKHCCGTESLLRIEEKLVLGPKKTLYLVHCKGRDILIAAGADTIASMVELAHIADADPARPLPRLQKRSTLS